MRFSYKPDVVVMSPWGGAVHSFQWRFLKGDPDFLAKFKRRFTSTLRVRYDEVFLRIGNDNTVISPQGGSIEISSMDSDASNSCSIDIIRPPLIVFKLSVIFILAGIPYWRQKVFFLEIDSQRPE